MSLMGVWGPKDLIFKLFWFDSLGHVFLLVIDTRLELGIVLSYTNLESIFP